MHGGLWSPLVLSILCILVLQSPLTIGEGLEERDAAVESVDKLVEQLAEEDELRLHPTVAKIAAPHPLRVGGAKDAASVQKLAVRDMLADAKRIGGANKAAVIKLAKQKIAEATTGKLRGAPHVASQSQHSALVGVKQKGEKEAKQPSTITVPVRAPINGPATLAVVHSMPPQDVSPSPPAPSAFDSHKLYQVISTAIADTLSKLLPRLLAKAAPTAVSPPVQQLPVDTPPVQQLPVDTPPVQPITSSPEEKSRPVDAVVPAMTAVGTPVGEEQAAPEAEATGSRANEDDLDAQIAAVSAQIKHLQGGGPSSLQTPPRESLLSMSAPLTRVQSPKSLPKQTTSAIDPEEMQFLGMNQLASKLYPKSEEPEAQLAVAQKEYLETQEDPFYQPMIAELRQATGDTVGHRQLARANKDVRETARWLGSLN